MKVSDQNRDKVPEDLIEHDIPRKAINLSDSFSIEEEQKDEDFEEEFGFEIERSPDRKCKKEPTHLSDGEAEMRRTVQVLFELEEALLDQHISNIKVRFLRMLLTCMLHRVFSHPIRTLCFAGKR